MIPIVPSFSMKKRLKVTTSIHLAPCVRDCPGTNGSRRAARDYRPSSNLDPGSNILPRPNRMCPIKGNARPYPRTFTSIKRLRNLAIL